MTTPSNCPDGFGRCDPSYACWGDKAKCCKKPDQDPAQPPFCMTFCMTCGESMRFNVPRLGPGGGYVHGVGFEAGTGLECDPVGKARVKRIVESALQSAQAEIVALREALSFCRRHFPSHGTYAEDMINYAEGALASTASDYAGKTVIGVDELAGLRDKLCELSGIQIGQTIELAELRKDRERLETIIAMLHQGKSPLRHLRGPNGEPLERYVRIAAIIGVDIRKAIDSQKEGKV